MGEGIRLRRSGLLLIANVPASAASARWWPAMNRLLERHAASLAVTVSLAHRFADRYPPQRVAALLAELRREVPRILLETVGGAARLAKLINSCPGGAELDLACVACCRGLAVRAIHRGRDLAGLFADGEGDDEDRDEDTKPLKPSPPAGLRGGGPVEGARRWGGGAEP